MRIHTGDKVRVLSGKDRNKEGLVTKVIPDKDKVIVEGLNVVKKHTKSQGQTQGGIVDREMPMHVSNVAVISPGDGKPTRIGYRVDDQGNKFRICKRTGNDL